MNLYKKNSVRKRDSTCSKPQHFGLGWTQPTKLKMCVYDPVRLSYPSKQHLSWRVQGYVNVCVCCNAGLGLSHETELYQATTHSSSRPPALNALADLSSLPTLHEHERGNYRALKSTECLHTISRKRKRKKSGNNEEFKE